MGKMISYIFCIFKKNVVVITHRREIINLTLGVYITTIKKIIKKNKGEEKEEEEERKKMKDWS